MPRSRSRDRDRRNKSRDRRSRSRSRERRRSRDRDYKRRDRSAEKYSRDKYDSYKRRSKDRSYRNRSTDRDRKHRDSRERRRQRSDSLDRKSLQDSGKNQSSSSTVKPIVIIASANKKSGNNRNKGVGNESNSTENSKNATDHRASFEISNEFSEEGFEQFSRDHGIDFSNIDTEDDRIAVHEKMEELLKAHFAAQGKVYPPPKQEKPVVANVTGFANDGSFLEQFKRMQEEMKQQQETEKKRQTAVNTLQNLPINKRRGGKILKTGLVAKTIVTPEGTITTNSFDSYYKEVQKYKNSSACDSESKSRPLVK